MCSSHHRSVSTSKCNSYQIKRNLTQLPVPFLSMMNYEVILHPRATSIWKDLVKTDLNSFFTFRILDGNLSFLFFLVFFVSFWWKFQSAFRRIFWFQSQSRLHLNRTSLHIFSHQIFDPKSKTKKGGKKEEKENKKKTKSRTPSGGCKRIYEIVTDIRTFHVSAARLRDMKHDMIIKLPHLSMVTSPWEGITHSPLVTFLASSLPFPMFRWLIVRVERAIEIAAAIPRMKHLGSVKVGITLIKRNGQEIWALTLFACRCSVDWFVDRSLL